MDDREFFEALKSEDDGLEKDAGAVSEWLADSADIRARMRQRSSKNFRGESATKGVLSGVSDTLGDLGAIVQGKTSLLSITPKQRESIKAYLDGELANKDRLGKERAIAKLKELKAKARKKG